MKKMKRILAMFMTLAMVLGMSMTAFAEKGTTPAETTTKVGKTTANITVKGLNQVATTVNVYQAVSFNGSGWTVAGWAQSAITGNPLKIGASEIKTLVENIEKGKVQIPEASTTTVNTNTGTAEIKSLPVGAYVIVPVDQDSKVTYAPMVATTFNGADGKDAAEDVEVTAKVEKYTVGKVVDDKFVGRGDTVTFTVTTTFPAFKVYGDDQGNAFKLKDTPVGLESLDVKSLTIGGTPVEGKNLVGPDEDGNYILDLSSEIKAGENAGKTVVVEYTAVVTAETFSNAASALKSYKDDNGTKVDDDQIGGGDESVVTSHSATIVLTKKDANDNNLVLKGAEFTFTLNGEVVNFVRETDGVYKKAVAGDTGAKAEVQTDDNGVLTLKGLGDGIYEITETKAPDGYTINGDIEDVTIVKNDEANVTVSVEVTDTKLSALPSTGGIGTTIFTIGGCVIMIAAAAMFFANRKKEEK